MYSACSRGRLGCFVVADFDPTRKSCPSKDFADTVMASKGILPKTDFWKRFPPYEEIEKQIKCDPDECIYYAKSGETQDDIFASSSDSDSERAANRKRPRSKSLLPQSVVDIAMASLLRTAKKPRQ